jgi:hypothetical protein
MWLSRDKCRRPSKKRTAVLSSVGVGVASNLNSQIESNTHTKEKKECEMSRRYSKRRSLSVWVSKMMSVVAINYWANEKGVHGSLVWLSVANEAEFHKKRRRRRRERMLYIDCHYTISLAGFTGFGVVFRYLFYSSQRGKCRRWVYIIRFQICNRAN